MNHGLVFSTAAEGDLLESIQWYNTEKKGLGFTFYDAVNIRPEQIVNNPQQFSIRFKNIHASKVNRYPILIYYKVDQDKSSFIILEILHTSRNPNTIKTRK